MFGRFISNIRNACSFNTRLFQEFALINIKRAFNAYKFGIIIVAFVIIVFSFFPAQNMLWKMRLLWANIIMFVFMSVMIIV